MSYTPRGVRSTLMHRAGIGFGAFGDTTPCARTAPSADGLSMECIDANNNVVSSTPITPTQAAAAASAAAGTTIFGLTPTSLALGVGGGLLLIMMLNKKKGR